MTESGVLAKTSITPSLVILFVGGETRLTEQIASAPSSHHNAHRIKSSAVLAGAGSMLDRVRGQIRQQGGRKHGGINRYSWSLVMQMILSINFKIEGA
jgi:hypothetical protein